MQCYKRTEFSKMVHFELLKTVSSILLSTGINI